ncbi:alpha/beta fold hydrolase [Blattabacterium cuenoti]|uniref:alpha/beta fold hydrolase n=1 Tax=Blattabacterium cuenoti TaxID=1653831 RepID=UPI00163CB2CA|nr:alpha/beta hydrolase [Blattabacterium cuenoti]
MYLSLDKNNIYYQIKGKGIPLVFLHGFMENLEIWKNINNFFSKKYQIISIDFPGHGKSFLKKNKKIFTMEKIADYIDLILKKENIKKAIFIGHSMGGYISLALLEKNPKLFLGLCLLHSTAESDNVERKNLRIRSIKLFKNNYSLFINNSINRLFYPKKLIFFKKEIFLLKKMALSTSMNSIIPFLRGMSIRNDRRFLLKTTNFPKLYITGLYDVILPANKLRKEVEIGYKICLKEIPTGHIGFIEQPNKVIDILKKFIQKIK